jgi:exosortase A
MVATWLRSDNFAHGFLIAPISIWLMWDKRDEMAQCHLEGAWLPVVLMLPVSLVWMAGTLVDVAVVRQLAFVTTLILGIWAVVGTPMARVLAFPLGFLFFSVPVGEGLVYPMMSFTADFTVTLLRATGIPVYREGTFFSIPSGDWSVVEACSGVRYLTASITLGVLYAYLTYTRLWKRLLFTAFAIVVPVIGNGLRAYLIVMLAHLSDMKLAVGVDHLIYGWVFFGFIVFVLFFVGSFWRDAPEERAPTLGAGTVGRVGRGLAIGGTALVIAASGPVLVWSAEYFARTGSAVGLTAPAGRFGWDVSEGSPWDWRPRVVGTDRDLYRFYASPDRPVGLYIGLYDSQRQGAELVSSANQMVVENDPIWSEKGRAVRSLDLPGGSLEVAQHQLGRRSGERLLVWNWYQVGDWQGANPYLAKVIDAGRRLLDQRSDGALIAVAAPYAELPDAAEAALKQFLRDMLPVIRVSVEQAVGGP